MSKLRHKKMGKMDSGSGTPSTKSAAPAVKPAIPGVDVMDEATAPAHGFKRGGGVVDGYRSKGNLGKAPRASKTGSTMRGRSPYSSASNLKPPVGGGG